MLNCFKLERSKASSWLLPLFFLLHIIACKKTETVLPTPLPSFKIADSTFKIVGITQIDINDFDISYLVNPPVGDTLTNLKLFWSQNADFSSSDSVILSSNVSGTLDAKHSIKRLKQATNYFARLSFMHKSKLYYSQPKEFKTDSLKLLRYPSLISRMVYTDLQSNFKQTISTTVDTSTKIYLDNILCTVTFTDGTTTQFYVPTSLPSKKYSLKFERNGISVIAPDSIELLMGKWSEITPPPIPLLGFPDNGIGFYSSCFSNEKGYIVPGTYFRQIQLPPTDPNYGRPGYILEFNDATSQWTKKTPTNPMYFDAPICHYANNAIYVISGATVAITNGDYKRIQRMLKFDLSTLTWVVLDSLPYTEIINMVSFEFNNEFYIGLGADGNNLDNNGIPLQSKKFWKYNPNSNTWTKLPDFPSTHAFNQNNPTAFVVGNKAYVFYGAIPIGNQFEQLNFRQELWEFDLTRNVWSQLNLPANGGPPIGEKYQIISYNNKAYFLTAQRSVLFLNRYGYQLQSPCLEFDPLTMSFKKISTTNNLGILKLVFRKGNQFVFQTDAFGYTEDNPNRTFKLILE